MTISAALSVALNAALLAMPWSADGARLSETRAPIVLNLAPAPPAASPASVQPAEQMLQAIETARDAVRTVEDTNLLSDKNANAADLALQDGTVPGPRVEDESPLVAVPLPPPVPVAKPSERTPRNDNHADREHEKKQAGTQDAYEESKAVTAENGESGEGESVEAASKEKTLLARATPAVASDAPQRARGRLDGRVMEQGFVGFEAIRDDVAAYYLEHVKPVIRRNWITNMLARYSGTMRAVADVEMAIAPDGTLAYAEIQGNPSNRIFAALCKLAIQQGTPFKPFPFRVPPEYRDQNLVIHCTFHWQ